MYTLPYLGCREPALIFCYTLPGNVYPIVESKTATDGFLGYVKLTFFVGPTSLAPPLSPNPPESPVF
jgi:hypothetical protein